MGSTSISNPTDNRLAVTDNGFGMTSSISGNNSALGYAPNSGFRNARDVAYLEAFSKQATQGSTIVEGGGINLAGVKAGGNVGLSWNSTTNMLDGGAIDRAFDFADKSLSGILASLVDAQKSEAAAADWQANTIASALEKSTKAAGNMQGAFSDVLGAFGDTLSNAFGLSSTANAYQANKISDALGTVSAATAYQANKINEALGGISQASNFQAAALANSVQRAAQTQQEAAASQAEKDAASQQRIKSLLTLGAVLGLGWWFFKGRKQ